MEEQEDDEINIDFSKIKNIFSKKKKTEDTKETTKTEEKESEATPSSEHHAPVHEEHTAHAEPEKETPATTEEHTTPSPEHHQEPAKEADKPHQESSEEDDDEEINLDLSKIKNIFSSKKAAHPSKEEDTPEDEKEDEEITFNFDKVKSSIKGIFAQDKDEEDGVDTKKITGFLTTHKTVLLTLLLILIPVFMSSSLRSTSADLPITDQWARDSVYNQVQDQIKSQINQQYPNLPQSNKNNLINTEFEKFQKEQKNEIEAQVKATADHFRSRLQDENGQTYLLAIDPYFWMRHAQNVIDNGHPGDELRKKQGQDAPYDTFMFAPVGRFVPRDAFHAYFEAFLFKIMRVFNRDVGLMTAAFYTPVLLIALSIIPIFFIGRRISGNFGGFVAAMILAIHPALLTRTAGGFADTDAYNILIPLIVTWLFLEAFETKEYKKVILYTLGAGFFVGLFSFAWGGWWYIMNFIIITSLAYIAYYILLNRDKLKNIGSFIKDRDFLETPLTLALFLIFSAIFTSFFTGFSNFMDGFLVGPRAFITLKEVGIDSIWPNVFTTVAEQNTASLSSVINQIGMGSKLLFLIAMSGLAWSLLKKTDHSKRGLFLAIGSAVWYAILLAIKPDKIMFIILMGVPVAYWLFDIIRTRQKGIDIKAALLLTLWFASTVYASTKGVRFTLVAVPAFALATGVAVNFLYKKGSELLTKGLHLNKHLVNAVVIIFLLLVLFGQPIQGAKSVSRQEIPSMNDAWYDSLKQIDLQADENAIINSWWDFGHWFKMIGNRPVTFDGTSQNTPNAHWIGSVLLTDDENYARGTLRMLDCGQNKAFDTVNKEIEDIPDALKVVKEIILLTDKAEAAQVLENAGITQIDEVLQYSHCTPPENYFITSHDMIGKGGVWAHFGSWNFERALRYNTLKKKEYQNDPVASSAYLIERFNMSQKQAEDTYFEIQGITDSAEANRWIAPWPSYQGESICSRQNDEVVSCAIQEGVGLNINLSTLQTAGVNTPQGPRFPNSISIAREDGTIDTVEYDEDELGISLSLYPTSDSRYRAVIAHPKLANALFTKLYYMNGHGTTYFEKFSDRTSFTGGRIIVWKVNWEGNATNEVPYYTTLREEQQVINTPSNEVDTNTSANTTA
tara:strand:+ start:310 stop:3693 length:3384 start_codon:yes stop_codon:yes gene_type:complete